ncbi:hypothetical protein Nepgr_021528 [Nepenthes gracilis]|uniref:Growth-regulating factor n=1 Tax=Nepenthes gracilis TaxID=150966 RepID=A0AAD3SYW8_NEPGR|nr:hypothetical protein Nepgr_021528 [Nepenthes gracilis]
MNSESTAATSMRLGMMRGSPFTVSQWQELEHQALIYKYLMAGLPVPPDLIFPIQKSFESLSSGFFHHPTMGYCSFYGKKVDPEPGRCRRTDGKKWRCSKEANPDSKYCERHMHRGRNRSRKPVESQTISQSSSSSVPTKAADGSGGGGGRGGTSSSCAGDGFQNLPLLAFANSQAPVSGTHQIRYTQGLKPALGEHSFFSDASGSFRGPAMESIPFQSFAPSKSAADNSMLCGDYPQYSFLCSEFSLAGLPAKQDSQSLRPIFNEWPPKGRDSWSGLENETSFSTTQLSMSIPTASSDFSASSQSAHEN